MICPTLYQGFGWKNPFYLQGIKHLFVLIQESVNPDSQTGMLLRATAELFRVDLGINLDLSTTNPKFFLQYARPCWYSHFWKFLHKTDLEIVEDYPSLPLLRTNGVFLMTEFVKLGYSNNCSVG